MVTNLLLLHTKNRNGFHEREGEGERERTFLEKESVSSKKRRERKKTDKDKEKMNDSKRQTMNSEISFDVKQPNLVKTTG